MRSLIYSGRIIHDRREPVRLGFVLTYFFYGIDLYELPQISQEVRGFGYNLRRPVFLRDRDYLCGEGGFKERLSRYVDLSEVDRIVLITVPGFLAKVFNPVSFYYCLRRDGDAARIVAEVNNTFGDRHLYVLDAGGAFPLRCSHEKRFHVSPFNDMRGHYEFHFSAPETSIAISIRLVRDGKVVLNTALRGRGRPLDTRSLRSTHLAHPLTPLKTVPRILVQAARLYYGRGLPVFKRPAPDDPMTIKVRK